MAKFPTPKAGKGYDAIQTSKEATKNPLMTITQSNRILLYNGDHNTNIDEDIDHKYTPLRKSRSISKKSINMGGQDFEFT